MKTDEASLARQSQLAVEIVFAQIQLRTPYTHAQIFFKVRKIIVCMRHVSSVFQSASLAHISILGCFTRKPPIH